MGTPVEQRRPTDQELKQNWTLMTLRGQGKLWHRFGKEAVRLDAITLQNAFDAFNFQNVPVDAMEFSTKRLSNLRNIDEIHQFLGETSVLLRAQAQRDKKETKQVSDLQI